jgi:hypothetical protein
MARRFLISLSKIELAWAAGLYDGEGSAYIVSKKAPNTPGLSVWQSYRPDVLHRFAAATGGLLTVYGPYGSPTNPRRGPKWRCSTAGFEQVQAIAALLWPYLSAPKKEQLKQVLLKARDFIPYAARTHCPQGHAYTAENTYRCLDGGRRCRACARDRANARNRAKGVPMRRKAVA